MAQQRTTKTLDERFDDVTVAIVEQRDFTTFAFDKVRREMRQVEKRLTRRLGRYELLLSEVLGEVRRQDGMLGHVLSDVKRHELLLSEVLGEVKRQDGVLHEILDVVKARRP